MPVAVLSLCRQSELLAVRDRDVNFDDYAGRGESPGIWAGRGAELRGLAGVVDDGDLGTLLRGVDPASQARLRTHVRERTITVRVLDAESGEWREEAKRLAPVSGFDLVFSCPTLREAALGVTGVRGVEREGRALTSAIRGGTMRKIFVPTLLTVGLCVLGVSAGGAAPAPTSCGPASDATSGNDTLVGTAAADRLTGLGGHDTIVGLAGNDCLDGGEGNDSLSGGAGNDRIFGGNGADEIAGGAGNDRIDAGGGFNAVEGGFGNDTLQGGDFFDDLSGGRGNDELNGGASHDFLSGGLGDDGLNGGAGIDDLSGGRGNDRLFGADGDDVLSGGLGSDRMSGGRGNDTLDGGPGVDTYEAGPGNDYIDAADGTVERVGCGPGTDTVLADAGDRLFNCERISRLQPSSG